MHVCKSSLLSHSTAQSLDACPQEQAASAAPPSSEAGSASGKAAQQTHKQDQLQRNLTAVVKAEAEKTRDIQSLGMLGVLGVAYARQVESSCLSHNST